MFYIIHYYTSPICFKWDIVKTKAQLIFTSKIVMLNSGHWESLAHLKNVYTKEIFCEPFVCILILSLHYCYYIICIAQ